MLILPFNLIYSAKELTCNKSVVGPAALPRNRSGACQKAAARGLDPAVQNQTGKSIYDALFKWLE